MFKLADPRSIIYGWYRADKDAFPIDDFIDLIEPNEYSDVFFGFNIQEHANGNYIDSTDEDVLDREAIHAMAQRIVKSDDVSQDERLSAQTYIERYNRGVDERD